MARKQTKKQRSGAQERHEQRSSRSKRRPESVAEDGGVSDAEWAAIVRQHFAKRKRQKIGGAILAAAGALVIVNHFLEHAGTIGVLNPLISPTLQDVVAGYPFGAILLFGAVILFGQLDDPPSRASLARQRKRP
jgi:hypothetical protein